jgi:hypothetical protein
MKLTLDLEDNFAVKVAKPNKPKTSCYIYLPFGWKDSSVLIINLTLSEGNVEIDGNTLPLKTFLSLLQK